MERHQEEDNKPHEKSEGFNESSDIAEHKRDRKEIWSSNLRVFLDRF